MPYPKSRTGRPRPSSRKNSRGGPNMVRGIMDQGKEHGMMHEKKERDRKAGKKGGR